MTRKSAVALRDADMIPCRLCGKPTRMLGTRLCDGCWELERRVESNPELTAKILADMPKHAAGEKPLRTVVVITSRLDWAVTRLAAIIDNPRDADDIGDIVQTLLAELQPR